MALQDRPTIDTTQKNIATTAIVGLFALACIYTLYVARDIFIPVSAAIVLSVMLTPVMRLLRKSGLSSWLSSGIIVLGIIAGLSLTAYALSTPAVDWMVRLPQNTRDLQQKLATIKRPVEEAKKVSENVAKITELESAAPSPGKPQPVIVKTPGFIERFSGGIIPAGASLVVVAVLLFFILGDGKTFFRNVLRSIPELSERRRIMDISILVQQDVSRYLSTVTLINAALGIVVGLALYAVGLPNPALWGVVVALLNYIPYFGPLVGVIIVALAGIVSFDTLQQALLGPIIYIIANGIEGHIVTPMVLGRRLTLSPITIFLAVLFWGWLWGIAGALIAIPLTVAIKVINEHVSTPWPINALFGHAVKRETVDKSLR